MGRQLRIGVDIDGVVYLLSEAWTAEYNRIYNQNLKIEDWTDFNFKGMKLECTPEQFLAIHKQADVQWAAPPITGAMQTLTQLNADGHLICFISSGKRSSIPIKVAKLMLDLPDIPYELHFTTEKWHVNVDVMIDDNPFFMRQWLMMFDMPPLLFYRQPWNADDITPPDSLNEVYTVTNWREVYKTINRDILGEEVTW